ncbi:MAG: energy transducer TonB [Acidobacteria bacterium]|nr:energy transducer TonB [Acidobacteriota bacterium]
MSRLGQARIFFGGALFVAVLLIGGPQPASPPRRSMVAPPPPSSAAPLPRPWREAVRAGIPSPRKTRHVDPLYPEAARQARIEGVVILEILIDEGGRVQDARVLRSVALLDEAALDAVKQWRFSPSILDDQPVKVVLTVEVNFALRG